MCDKNKLLHAKVGGVKRNAAWCSFVHVHNVADCLRHNQNYARDNQEQGDIFPVSPCKCVYSPRNRVNDLFSNDNYVKAICYQA